MLPTAAAMASKIPSTSQQLFTHHTLLISYRREYRQVTAHIEHLQEQVNDLYSTLNALHARQDAGIASGIQQEEYRRKSSTIPIDPQIAQPQPTPTQSNASAPKAQQWKGPTSSAYGFELANHSLQSMGITQAGYAEEAAPSSTAEGLASPRAGRTSNARRDPIFSFSRKDISRLIQVYDEGTGIMFPMISLSKIMKHAETSLSFAEALMRTGFMAPAMEGGDQLYDEDTQILKMIMAIALELQDSGPNEMAIRLYESIQQHIEEILWKPKSISGVQLLALVVST
jgi:hypothetical protein